MAQAHKQTDAAAGMAGPAETSAHPRWPGRLLAFLMIFGALGLSWGGGVLVSLGGSPAYLLQAALLGAAGVLLWRANRWALWIYGGLVALAALWALWEVGLDAWAMLPRLGLFYALGLALLLPAMRRGLRGGPGITPGARRAALAALLALAAATPGAALVFGTQTTDDPAYRATVHLSANGAGDSWPGFGGSPSGTRFSQLDQITPQNAAKLRVAWTYSFHQPDSGGLEVTPIKIGDTVYACDDLNRIAALDPETGHQKWLFNPHIDKDAGAYRHCRGVGYAKIPGASGLCAERIYTATGDARLIAIDATTGQRCPGFGKGGDVNTLEGLGVVLKGYYWYNSAPNVFDGKVIVSGTMVDNQYWGEPSGVIRAYDAATGQLAWAYDVGVPDRIGAPPPGKSYTPATPNVWAQMAFDPALGLLYVGTGNATPDYYGAQRRKFDDEISSAIMALDIKTGRRKWLFQTVHHDLWDYDIGAQPLLVDLPGAGGKPIPALIQPTKLARFFVLNRVTGQPIGPVVEQPAPQAGHAVGERVSPTQPMPLALPTLAGPRLREAAMWGLTPFDQLWCRIKFRQARYDGPYTPPGEQPSITYPGYLGGMDWGSASVDTDRAILVAATSYVPNYTQLIPRTQAKGAYPMSRGREGLAALVGINAMEGTPYAGRTQPFLSPLQVPCTQPPWGRIHAIDLASRKLIWSRPLGTGRDNGPLGIPSHLPFTIGAPVMGGVLVTRGGLSFVGGSTDKSFRAFATTTGRLLWQADLPHSGNATPMSYRSGRSGRQFVVIAAAGHAGMGAPTGDELVAFALPGQ